MTSTTAPVSIATALVAKGSLSGIDLAITPDSAMATAASRTSNIDPMGTSACT